MTTNKEYRQHEGYEESLSLSSDIVDVVDDLKALIRYGKSKEEILKEVVKIEYILTEIKKHLS